MVYAGSFLRPVKRDRKEIITCHHRNYIVRPLREECGVIKLQHSFVNEPDDAIVGAAHDPTIVKFAVSA